MKATLIYAVTLLSAVLFLGCQASANTFAQNPPQPAAIPLWPAGAPGAKGSAPEDIPSIQLYAAPADKASGAAIVVCPGGGYGALASHEGHDIAVWLNSIGVTAVVLLTSIGEVLWRLDRPDSALVVLRTAMRTVTELGERGQQIRVSNAIGNVYADLGQPDSALAYFRRSLSLTRQLRTRYMEGIALNNIGWVNAEHLGRPDSALAYYVQALAVARQLDHALVQIAGSPDTQERFTALGFNTRPIPRERYAGFIRAEMDKWRRVVKEAAVKVEE